MLENQEHDPGPNIRLSFAHWQLPCFADAAQLINLIKIGGRGEIRGSAKSEDNVFQRHIEKCKVFHEW